MNIQYSCNCYLFSMENAQGNRSKEIIALRSLLLLQYNYWANFFSWIYPIEWIDRIFNLWFENQSFPVSRLKIFFFKKHNHFSELQSTVLRQRNMNIIFNFNIYRFRFSFYRSELYLTTPAVSWIAKIRHFYCFYLTSWPWDSKVPNRRH